MTVVGGGCASRAGWQPSEARTCEPGDPPRVCVVAEPDFGHVVGVADVEILPGECAVAAADSRGGLARIETRDRVGGQRKRWLSTPKGRTTLVELDAEGKLEVERQRCDQIPFSVDASSSRD